MPKLLFARRLSALERRVLEGIMSGEWHDLKRRALTLLLSADEAYRVPQIATIVGMSPRQVRKLIKRFNEHGLKGLHVRQSGRLAAIAPGSGGRIVEIDPISPNKRSHVRCHQMEAGVASATADAHGQGDRPMHRNCQRSVRRRTAKNSHIIGSTR